MEEEGKGEAILERTIIFTIARMNPPTPGHLLLIKTLTTEAIERDVNDVFIILSKTTFFMMCRSLYEIDGASNITAFNFWIF